MATETGKRRKTLAGNPENISVISRDNYLGSKKN